MKCELGEKLLLTSHVGLENFGAKQEGTIVTRYINRTASPSVPAPCLFKVQTDIKKTQNDLPTVYALQQHVQSCITSATISPRMANQPIDDPAGVLPAKTATGSPALRSSGGAEKQLEGAEDARLAKKASAFKSLGWLDRFLALWILLAMVLGVLLGNFVPEVGPALQKGKFADVSIPIGMSSPLSIVASRLTVVAVGLLVMMYPILCKVQYEILHSIFLHRGAWKQIGFSVFVNWIVAPLFMVCMPRYLHARCSQLSCVTRL